jgi:hypothetical protein
MPTTDRNERGLGSVPATVADADDDESLVRTQQIGAIRSIETTSHSSSVLARSADH